MIKKILVIEDNTEMRENTAEILALAKYKVHTANNGKEGVKVAQKEIPDLIICDIMMPELDGYGVLYLLAKNEETGKIPFIFLSAKVQQSDQRKGMNMGADDYLCKPFDERELLKAIEIRMKKNALLRKKSELALQNLSEFMNQVKGPHPLSQGREFRFFKKKESVYIEGNYPRGIFFILNGIIKTHKTNEEGKEFITGLYKQGDFFGYLALLEDCKYSDSASTLEDTRVRLIHKNDFEDLIYKNADASKKFIKILSNNLHEKEEELIKLAYNSVRKRVAESLMRLYNHYKKEGEYSDGIPISREDLANLAGTSVETTVRTLSDFREAQLIGSDGGGITILNPKKLREIED